MQEAIEQGHLLVAREATSGHSLRDAERLSLTVDIHEGRQGRLPPDVRQAWEECLRLAPAHQQFLTYEWVEAWLATRTLLESPEGWSGSSRTYVVRNSMGAAVAILPLAQRRQYGVNWWSLAGPYQPLRGFLCLEQGAAETCAALAQSLQRSLGATDFLRLGPIESGAPEWRQLLPAIQATNRNSLSIPLGANVAIQTLASTVEDFDRHLQTEGGKRGKKILKLARKWEREPGASARHFHCPKGEDLATAIDTCGVVERNSWLVPGGGKLRFSSPADREMWLRIGEFAAPGRVELDVWIAYLNERPIAFDFSLTTGPICYMIAGHFDEEFQKLGIGWSLAYLNTVDQIARGVRYVDFAPGTVEYKKVWGCVEEPHSERLDWFLMPAGAMGTLVHRTASLPPIRARLTAYMNGDL